MLHIQKRRICNFENGFSTKPSKLYNFLVTYNFFANNVAPVFEILLKSQIVTLGKG